MYFVCYPTGWRTAWEPGDDFDREIVRVLENRAKIIVYVICLPSNSLRNWADRVEEELHSDFVNQLILTHIESHTGQS